MIALGTLAAVLAVVAGPQWSTPVQISAPARALGPALAMNGSGDALVVWDQEIGADCATAPASLSCIHVVTAVERPTPTAPWTAPIALNRPGVGSRPQVAIDRNGDAAVIWVHDIGVDRVLQATYRRGASGTWPEPNDLSDYVLAVTNHEVGLDAQGNVYATWAERTDGGSFARYETRPVFSGVWSAPLLLARDLTGGPALTVSERGGPSVAWEETGRVFETSRPPFSEGAVPVVLGTTPAGEPAIAAADELALVFPAIGENGPIVEGAVYRAGLAADPVGAARAPDDARPDVATSGSTIVAVWLAPDGVKAADASPLGAWSTPAKLTRDGGANDPHVAVDGHGNAVAVWISGAGSVQAAIRPAATRAWQPAATLSGSGASAPHVAMDANGNALAVWNETSGDALSVQSRQLSATGPVVRMVAPKRAQVRRRVVFKAFATAWASPVASAPSWAFGDSKTATGARVMHRYARPGRYRVTVTQRDAAGGMTTARATVTVARQARR